MPGNCLVIFTDDGCSTLIFHKSMCCLIKDEVVCICIIKTIPYILIEIGPSGLHAPSPDAVRALFES